jgi:iron complex outermembrane recepter protein
MPSLSLHRRLRPVLVFTATAVAGAVFAIAGEPRTQMAPFRVEAEFGVDGLRIQNSNAVINQYLLEQHAVAQLQDVTGLAPNLSSSNSDSRGFGDILTLRGLANSIFFSAPAVVLYVDDVPSGSVSSYPSALLNIASLNVKAGPQGTEYGRNAPGGVIDLKTQTPGSRPQGRIVASRGSFKATHLLASVDGPLTDALGYSASFGFDDRDGYIKNRFLGRTADDRQAYAGRAALYWKPDDALQLRFGAMIETARDGANRLTSLFSRDPFEVHSNIDGQTTIDRLQFSFQARRRFDWGTITATTSRQDFKADPILTDLDLSPESLGFSRVVQEDRVWTQEIRFDSIPQAGQAQWRAGLFYFNSQADGDALREFVVPPSNVVPPGFLQTERTFFGIDQVNLAGYANVTQPLTKQTALELGLRVERNESDLDRTKNASNNFRFPTPQDPRLVSSQRQDHASASTGLSHLVSEELSVRARTSLAQKPEGFSGFAGSPRLARFDAERTWANEVGLTFSPPKARYGGSLLGFWNQIRDYQFERTVPGSTDFVVVNAKEVVARGFEAKVMVSPLERLWWDFQAGFTKATFEDHRDALGTNMSGKPVPYIPRYTLRTGVTVDLGSGFSANASYQEVGRTSYDERNTRMFSQGSYGIVNAQVRYHLDRFSVTVYGQNLGDKRYYQFINPEIYAGSPGAPRRFGVQLSYAY